MTDFALEKMNFALEMAYCALKMMNFALKITDLGPVIHSREGQRAMLRALQLGFESVKDCAERDSLGIEGIEPGLLSGKSALVVERVCYNCCRTGHFSNDCPEPQWQEEDGLPKMMI